MWICPTASADLTIPVNVRGTNATPTGSDVTKTTALDTDLTFAKTDFAITDSDGDPLKEIRIETLPASAAGTLKLDGTVIASTDLPQTVTHTQFDDGDLVFDPVSTFNGNATFTFKVVDPFDAVATAANTATITVGSVNTAPVFSGRHGHARRDDQRGRRGRAAGRRRRRRRRGRLDQRDRELDRRQTPASRRSTITTCNSNCRARPAGPVGTGTSTTSRV